MRVCIQFIVAFLLILAVTVSSFGGAVSGAVFGVWSLADSPYIVTGETYVPTEQQLIIDPGVQVRFTAGASLTVFGQLTITGTPQANVTIGGYYSAVWDGIRFQNSNSNLNSFSYTNIYQANNPLLLNNSYLIIANTIVDGYSVGLTMVRSTFQMNTSQLMLRSSNSIGISAVESDLSIANSVIDVTSIGFAQNAIGVQATLGLPDLQNNQIRVTATSTAVGFILQNQNIGIIRRNIVRLYSSLENNGFELSDVGAGVQIHHNTIRTMTNGSIMNGMILSSSRNVDVRNNIFWGRDYGVGRQIMSGIVNWNFNLLDGFEVNYSNGPPGQNDIQSNPLLDATTLVPTLNSPAINSGDPTMPPDPDGTLPDIGAIPYLFTNVNQRTDFVPSQFEVSTYPNPFNSQLRIRANISGDLHLRIFNVTGQLIYQEKRVNLQREYSTLWHPSNLSSGWYIIEIQSNQKFLRKSVLFLQ